MLHFLNDNSNAEAFLKQASQKSKNNFDVVKTGCRIELSKGNLNGAAQLLNMARNIDNNSELFVIRALFVLKQNNTQLAKQYLDKAMELDNTNQEAKQLLKSVQTTAKQNTQQTEDPQQSIMFQKKTEKKANPLNLR